MSLKCALDILEKNEVIKVTVDKKGFYNYWRIDIKVNEYDFRKKLNEKIKEQEHCLILESFLSDRESWIEITTHKAIINGLKRVFEKDESIKWRGPIHKLAGVKINKFINETEKYKGSIYGHNDLGTLIEIKDIEKENKEKEERLRKEKEAIDLLDKIL